MKPLQLSQMRSALSGIMVQVGRWQPTSSSMGQTSLKKQVHTEKSDFCYHHTMVPSSDLHNSSLWKQLVLLVRFRLGTKLLYHTNCASDITSRAKGHSYQIISVAVNSSTQIQSNHLLRRIGWLGWKFTSITEITFYQIQPTTLHQTWLYKTIQTVSNGVKIQKPTRVLGFFVTNQSFSLKSWDFAGYLDFIDVYLHGTVESLRSH